MAWYYGTFACGHEGRVNIVGKVKDRQWKADRKFEKLCPDCWEKEIQKRKEIEYEQACQEAQEMELPELQGTEKQTRWAMVIRKKFVNVGITELLQEIEESPEDMRITQEQMDDCVEYLLMNYTKASWWIDNRNTISDPLFCEKVLLNVMNELQKKEEEEIYQDVLEEATAFPENPKTTIPATITISDDMVAVSFEKNDEFRQIVKELNYKWENGKWCRKINELTGSAADRAAELGNKLLNAGFPIVIIDRDIRQAAIKGQYEQECDRWILKEDENHLKIKWWEQNDRLYQVSRSLPGSRWKKGTIVHIAHYQEIQDFANMYGFKLTKDAQKAIEHYIEQIDKIKTVTPAVVPEMPEKDGLKDILESSREVLPDLIDD